MDKNEAKEALKNMKKFASKSSKTALDNLFKTKRINGESSQKKLLMKEPDTVAAAPPTPQEQIAEKDPILKSLLEEKDKSIKRLEDGTKNNQSILTALSEEHKNIERIENNQKIQLEKTNEIINFDQKTIKDLVEKVGQGNNTVGMINHDHQIETSKLMDQIKTLLSEKAELQNDLQFKLHQMKMKENFERILEGTFETQKKELTVKMKSIITDFEEQFKGVLQSLKSASGTFSGTNLKEKMIKMIKMAKRTTYQTQSNVGNAEVIVLKNNNSKITAINVNYLSKYIDENIENAYNTYLAEIQQSKDLLVPPLSEFFDHPEITIENDVLDYLRLIISKERDYEICEILKAVFNINTDQLRATILRMTGSPGSASRRRTPKSGLKGLSPRSRIASPGGPPGGPPGGAMSIRDIMD